MCRSFLLTRISFYSSLAKLAHAQTLWEESISLLFTEEGRKPQRLAVLRQGWGWLEEEDAEEGPSIPQGR